MYSCIGRSVHIYKPAKRLDESRIQYILCGIPKRLTMQYTLCLQFVWDKEIKRLVNASYLDESSDDACYYAWGEGQFNDD